jgi:hypothetical protein
MSGQIYYGGLVKGWRTTICGGLAKFSRIRYILKYHNRFCFAKTCDYSN